MCPMQVRVWVGEGVSALHSPQWQHSFMWMLGSGIGWKGLSDSRSFGYRRVWHLAGHAAALP